MNSTSGYQAPTTAMTAETAHVETFRRPSRLQTLTTMRLVRSRNLVLTVLSLLFLTLLAREVAWETVRGVFHGIEWTFFLASVALALGTAAVRGARLSQFYDARGRSAELYGIFSYLSFLNYVLPFKTGEPAALVLLKQRAFIPSIREAIPVWLLLRFGDLFGLAVVFTAAAVAWLIAGGTIRHETASIYAATVAALVAGTVLTLVAKIVFDRYIGDRSGVQAVRHGRILSFITHLTAHPARLAVTAGLSILLWTLLLSMFVAAEYAVGVRLSVDEAYVIAAVAAAMNLLPIRGPLGLGTSDAVWAIAFRTTGIPFDESVALAFGVRVVQMAGVLLNGLSGLVLMILADARRPDEAVTRVNDAEGIAGTAVAPSEAVAAREVPAGMQRDRPVVIYIAGWGHSGSTLLARLIGSSPNVVLAGEVLFWELYRDRISHEKVVSVYTDFECSCKRAFQECEFWRPILAADPDHTWHVVRDRTVSDRLRWLARLVRWRISGRKTAHSLGDDAALLGTILSRATPGTQFICDSSKDFGRLARLLMNPELQVVPILLVRDGRAVAHSYSTPERFELGLPRTTYLRSLINWTAVNLLTWMTCTAAGVRPIHLSYNRFCERPDDYIRFLNGRLGLEIPTRDYIGRVNSEVFHNIGGNVGRFKPLDEIRVDDRWRLHVPRAARMLGTMLLFPFNALWVRQDHLVHQDAAPAVTDASGTERA